jgi:pimeloyl-ACP methyl ester carboxylesterase
MGPKRNISGTYSISTKLCWPESLQSPSNSSIQLLTHGVGFDKSYWDFYSASYSYQDAAAKAGYATLSYDRLGTGSSAHPDPIQVVQAPMEIEIAHQIIQQLRNTKTFGNTQFEKAIGVGHSLGSELTNAITAQHPQDLDAAVLTGFSIDSAGQADFFSGLDLVIARENQPFRFSNLTNGYLIPDSIVSNQFGFFRAPNFDPLVLAAAEATKQTFTIGELFTNSMFMGKAGEFRGPIDVVDGENDLPFCRSNCLVPQNKAAAVKGALYSNAKNSSTSFVAKGAGHGLNLHYVAGDAYRQIFNFLKENGF